MTLGADGATVGRGGVTDQLHHYSNKTCNKTQGTCPKSTAINRSQLNSMYLRAAGVLLVFCALGCMTALTVVQTFLQHRQLWPALLLVAVVAEGLFACAWLRKYRRLSEQPLSHKPAHPSFDPRHAFDRFRQSAIYQHKHSRWICIKEMLSMWFGGVPFEEIKVGNVCDLVTYGFWYMSREQYERELGSSPELLVAELEEASGITIAPGYNPDISFMAHLWQPIRCHYRPFAFYVAMEVIFVLSRCIMLAMGFRVGTINGFTYYTYGVDPFEGPGQPARIPILFQHGVGVGLLPYSLFVARIACLGHPVAALEVAHLGMRWSEVLDADQVVDGISALLTRRLGWARTCVSGHSYGTFYASRLLQLYPDLVDSLCLVDPVTFNMFTGKLIRNFVYHVPDIITWFVARDIHHAASVCRNFFWSCLCLWPDQLPERTMVVLSEADDLVPVKETVDMLRHEAPHALVMHHPNHRHADFIADIPWQDAVVSSLADLLDVYVPPTSPHQATTQPQQQQQLTKLVQPQQQQALTKEQQRAGHMFDTSDLDSAQQVGSDSSAHDGTYLQQPHTSPARFRRRNVITPSVAAQPPTSQPHQQPVTPKRRSARKEPPSSKSSAALTPTLDGDTATHPLSRLRPKPHRVLSPQA